MLDRAVESKGRVEQDFQVLGHDEDGTQCATIDVTWSVREK